MHYQVSRNGQTYGPYTLEDIQRYVASGNVLPTDLAKNEEMTDWIPVSELLANFAPPPASPFTTPGFANPTYPSPTYTDPNYNPAAANAQALASFPDAPNLHWGLVLLFGFLTCSLFMYVWNVVIALWLKRVQPNANSLFFYIGWIVLTFLQFTVAIPFMHHNTFGPHIHTSYNPISSLVGLVAWIVKLIARFSQRASLEEHFNGPEPVGLQLNPVMVFFFGGIYFQYHLNRINMIKQAARFSTATRPY